MPTLYETSIPVFIRQLNILSKILQRGVAHAKDPANAVTEQSLVDARLIADMQTLAYQIQRVSDTAKGVPIRVAKLEPVAFEDNEKTFPELQERIAKTIKFLESVDAEEFNKHEDSELVMQTGGGDMTFTGKNYVLNVAIPNFFFHFVTAYDILRAQGVDIGKRHYLGRE